MLIKATAISEIVGTGGNIDTDQLTPSISVAQTTKLKRILGLNLYNKILADYSVNPDNNQLSGIYKIIYDDYVRFMLSFFSASIYLSISNTKTTNAGSYKVGAEGSTNTPLNELTIIGKNYEAIAIDYEKNFYDFIEKNPVPEYDNNKRKDLTSLIQWF